MFAYITIDIDPIIGHLGPFALRWYPLIMALGVIVGAFIFASQLRRKGIDTDHVIPMLVAVVPSAIIGARLFSVLDNWGYYSDQLLLIVKPPYAGLAIYGVLTGGILALAIYCHVKRLPVLRVLDCLALAIPVGGRRGHVLVGCASATAPCATGPEVWHLQRLSASSLGGYDGRLMVQTGARRQSDVTKTLL